jgi:hypothetical protein
MPKFQDWIQLETVEFSVREEMSEYMLEKYFARISSTNTKSSFCSICTSEHIMKIAIFKCRGKNCNVVDKCPVQYKLMRCSDGCRYLVFKLNNHVNLYNLDKQIDLTKINRRGISFKIKNEIKSIISTYGHLKPLFVYEILTFLNYDVKLSNVQNYYKVLQRHINKSVKSKVSKLSQEEILRKREEIKRNFDPKKASYGQAACYRAWKTL